MTSAKDELLAAGIRKQIIYLERLLRELESNPEQDKTIALEIRRAEIQLRALRNQL